MLVSLDNARTQNRSEIGCKAANLGEIASLGLSVPKGFVIPVRIWDTIATSNIPPGSRFQPQALDKALGHCFEAELMKWFDSLEVEFAAVRSSSVLEDSTSFSFAGMFESTIGVPRKSLLKAIAKCWGSTNSPRAHAYCEANHIAVEDIRIAVIVQALVQPTTSGVCFTQDPISTQNSHLVIEAAYGFGESIVSGKVMPDIYTYDSDGWTITSRVVNEQRTELQFSDGHLREAWIPPDLRQMQKLSDSQVHQLAAECVKLRHHFGSHQDIEFAYDANTLFFLQSRPISSVKKV